MNHKRCMNWADLDLGLSDDAFASANTSGTLQVDIEESL